MLTDELEELVLNIDASPQVPVVLKLRLVLIPKCNPAQHIFEAAVGLLDGYEALQQSFLQLLSLYQVVLLPYALLLLLLAHIHLIPSKLMNLERAGIIRVPIQSIENKIRSREDMYEMLSMSCKAYSLQASSISLDSRTAQSDL